MSSSFYNTLLFRAYYFTSQRKKHHGKNYAEPYWFRTDNGIPLDEPWLLSFLTCAAPYTPAVGQPHAGDLLQERIHRVLAFARAYEYSALVLGAWGCGAFGNDPERTARDFHSALAGEFSCSFSEVVFAITAWSPERRYLQPFCRVLATL